jgi:hypothetical protein
MRKSVVLAAGVALIAGACQDAAGPDDSAMSRAEAMHVAAVVAASSEGAAGTAMTSEGTTADMYSPPVSFTHTHQSTHPCPSGGAVALDFTVDGMFDGDTHTLQADLAGTQTHAACGVVRNGVTITIDGNPGIGFTASIGAANGQPTQPFTHGIDGSFSWSTSDGRSGTCDIDVSAVTDLLARERTVQGSVCGHTFNQTTTWN